MTSTILELANSAHPINDDDWGTERQIDAQNAFFNAAEEMGLDMDDFEEYAHKATAEEMIGEALRRLGNAAISEVFSADASIDDVCLRLQQHFGIESGDGASYCLHHVQDNWGDVPTDEKTTLLKAWLSFEFSM